MVSTSSSQHVNLDMIFKYFGANLDILRLRFCLWGEAMDFVSRRSDSPAVRLQGLDDRQIQSTLAQSLRAIDLVLKNADRTRDGLLSRSRSSSTALAIFQNTFQQFHLGTLRADRQQQSLTAATKWAVTSKQRFQEDIQNLGNLIDSLEQVSEF